jgi:hypothetical protein
VNAPGVWRWLLFGSAAGGCSGHAGQVAPAAPAREGFVTGADVEQPEAFFPAVECFLDATRSATP